MLKLTFTAFALLVACADVAGSQNLPSSDIDFAVDRYHFALTHHFAKDDPALRLEDTLTVRRTGDAATAPLFSETNYRWFLDTAHPEPERDVTGDNVPDVVVSGWSGGAHCCHETYIFELGETFRVHKLYSGDFPIRFVDLMPGGAMEIEGRDIDFLYWLTSFASSHAPRIVLAYRNGKYELAPGLMRKPPPDPSDLARRTTRLLRGDASNELAVAVTAWDEGRHASLRSAEAQAFLKLMIDLVYTGNMVAARDAVERTWPASAPGRKQFEEAFFSCQIRRSTHWQGIAALNGVPADPPEKSCPAGPEGG